MVLRGASTASGPLEALCGENPETRTKNRMNLSGLLPLIQTTPGLAPVLGRLSALRTPPLRMAERGPAPDGAPLVLGLPDTAKAATLAALAQGLAAPLLVLAARPDRARALVEELAVWLGDPDESGRVVLFPERDPLPYERLAPDLEAVSQRLRVLGVFSGEASAPSASLRAGPTLVASAPAGGDRTLTPSELVQATETLAVGSGLAPEGFLRRLVLMGYRFPPLVEEPGQASRRGGIIDVFSPTADAPLRVELVGDRVGRLRRFDPGSQRSVAKGESAGVGPA